MLYVIKISLHQVVTGIFVDSAVTTRTEDEVVDAFKALSVKDRKNYGISRF